MGGATALAMNARGLANYEEVIKATWRHSDSTDLPLASARRELVRYATTLAANSHNTQPWQFWLSDRSILVLPDARRHLPIVDPDDHHVFASLGCAVENMVQAARAFGLRAVPRYDPDARGIRVDLEAAPPERTDLFDAIPRRQTTRAVYDGGRCGLSICGFWKPPETVTACGCCLSPSRNNARRSSPISSQATALRWTMPHSWKN
jgi:hypothetical protein